MMRRLVALCSVLLVSACATTGMYDTPDAAEAAVLKIDNQLDQAGAEKPATGGWTMPAMNAPARAGIFTVDGDRLDEQGGDQQALLTPGKHQVQIFADDAGVLRFHKFRLKVKQGHEYVVRVTRNEGGADRYRAQVMDAAAPGEIIKEVTF